MLRTVSLLFFAIIFAVYAVDSEFDASMELTTAGDLTISSTPSPRGTKFTFAIPASSDLSTGDWLASLNFYKFSANATHRYISSISDCASDGSARTPSVSHTPIAGGISNTTLAFSVTADDFDNDDSEFEVTCQVTYAFRTPADAYVTASVASGSEAYLDDDVDFPAATFAKLGAVTTFSASITNLLVDLTPYGKPLYDKMVADIKAKAADISNADVLAYSYRTAANTELTIAGGVICGTASAVLGSGLGYACLSTLKVTFDETKLTQLAEIKIGYTEKLATEIPNLPEGTTPQADFATKEIDGSCEDGIVDGEPMETDVDCGYDACAKACDVGQKCGKALDCSTYLCIEGVCSRGNSAAAASVAAAVVIALLATFF